MRLTDNVYLIGSGKNGCELSHSKDCNVYVVDGGGEYAMIDAGSGLDPGKIMANAEALGIPVKQIKQLLLTHAHGDHAAGAAYFAERYGMEVWASWEAADWLEQGDMDKTSLDVAKKAGVYPDDFELGRCPVVRRLREHDRITVGKLELSVLETPGHSRGHLSFLLDEGNGLGLFSGDTIFACGKVYIQNIWDCSIPDYANSIAKLDTLGVERLFPGHGSFVLARASEHIHMAQLCFERLDVPPNL